MAINNAVLKSAGTLSVSGGTDITFKLTGLEVKGGNAFVDAASTDVRTRKQIIARSNPARVLPSGKWSKDKRELTVTIPKVLADGTQDFQSSRVDFNLLAESTAADLLELKTLTAQAVISALFADYWQTGAIS